VEHPRKGTAGTEEIESKFRDFVEAATEFVRMVSTEGGISYRGQASAAKDNLNVMKKVFGSGQSR
jgi:hypothetical protein